MELGQSIFTIWFRLLVSRRNGKKKTGRKCRVRQELPIVSGIIFHLGDRLHLTEMSKLLDARAFLYTLEMASPLQLLPCRPRHRLQNEAGGHAERESRGMSQNEE